MSLKPTILVDADACPVKSEIGEAARLYGVPVCMVASYDHQIPPQEGVRIIQVDRGKESADIYIVNQIAAGDIVITQDFGLACMAIGKGAIVLSPRGEQYTNDNIDYLMDRRYEQAKIRRSGGKTKGPKALNDADRDRFQQKLTKVLRFQQENHDV